MFKPHQAKTLLDIRDLSIAVHGKTIVDRINLQVHHGCTTALVGESGSGKTITSLAITKLLFELQLTGKILFEGENLVEQGATKLRHLRGGKIGYVFQEPMTALNPLHRVEKQIAETLVIHQYQHDHQQRVNALLEMVGLDTQTIKNRFIHQLSGGQRQRIMIAMALANTPTLLIADEPTTALDQHLRFEILRLLQDLQKRHQLGLLLISHDLRLVKDFSDYVAIMHQGKIIEQNNKNDIFTSPKLAYTQNLLQPLTTNKPETPSFTNDLLDISQLAIRYPIKRGILQRTVGWNNIIDDFSCTLGYGQTLGLVGASGSGKSSIAMALLGFIPYSGEIHFKGIALHEQTSKTMRSLRHDIQIVFQDPFSSLNPRMNVRQIIEEGIRLHLPQKQEDFDRICCDALEQVGLSKDVLARYPHQFSGGQRQRIALARVLALHPALLILDEPTSSLDKTNQRNILALLIELQKYRGLSYVFISHDMDAVETISHNIQTLDT